MSAQPPSADRYNFGPWTVSWNGTVAFGDSTRGPLEPVEAMRCWFAGLGSHGVTFPDHLMPFGSHDTARARQIGRFIAGVKETGLVVPTVPDQSYANGLAIEHLMQAR